MKNWRVGLVVIALLALGAAGFGFAAYTQKQFRELERRLQIVRLEPNGPAIALVTPNETTQHIRDLEERVRKLETTLLANVGQVHSVAMQNSNPGLEARISQIEEKLKPHIELLGQSQNLK